MDGTMSLNPFYVHSVITRNESVLTWGLYAINNEPTAVGGRDAACHKGLYRELRPLFVSSLACEQLQYLCLLSSQLLPIRDDSF